MTGMRGTNRLATGVALLSFWAAGLFAVLEAEPLIAKALILIAMAPLSLQLDRLMTLLMKPLFARAACRRHPKAAIDIEQRAMSAHCSLEERLVA